MQLKRDDEIDQYIDPVEKNIDPVEKKCLNPVIKADPYSNLLASLYFFWAEIFRMWKDRML